MTQPCPRCKERGTEGQLMKYPGDSVASCLQCGYEAVDIVSDPKKPYKPKWRCEACKKTFKGKKWFDKHMKKHHPATPLYEEKKTPHQEEGLPGERPKKRVKVKRTAVMKCEECGQECEGPQGLASHKRYTHLGYKRKAKQVSPRIEADQCGLKDFRRSEHPLLVKEMAFVCPVCKKPFDKKVQLDGHMATHSDRPTDSMGVLEQAEKVLRKNIVASMDGQKDKLKEARRHVLEAIEVLL